ncbi:outer membrane protein assembly factor BamD [Hymenobacter swuensis]|uniref:Lipoprotein n=1 Tax=Hymenobacter swuensis DY53 TaxID=1227739 RepID=W8FCB5_9BACT|nr:hypothetical protein [Hymenobacter swuensis]AHJ99335.1 hypothetical protein Hsw_3740 [Hymenobacter swuensis DY53]
MKSFLYLFLLITGLLSAAGCSSKQDDPTPRDPEAVVSLQRTISYPSGSLANQVQEYSQLTLQTKLAAQTDGSAQLSFVALGGKDKVILTIAQSLFSTGQTGSYALKNQFDPQGSFSAAYTYYVVNRPGELQSHSYSANHMQGKLTVTSYDTQRRLLSGTYHLVLADVADPNDETLGNSSGLRSRVELVGSFENLKME